ncbi:beta-lactamase domain-containing protein [Methylorubrum populi]|uniref:Beta-lactamase domain-containing protein n=1 Tax=Methylorubrum populi TaxID=223967 RepID=A0A161JL40_9HYPH|nr:MBL fold metallo-hydrolase [Methylorubrum populi]BAU88822.1 beta-lactamase domain-containing protein [Methylorubrum populi]
MTDAIRATDPALTRAKDQVTASRSGAALCPAVRGFFDEPTNTATFVVYDPVSREAAVIDSVLDFDPAAGALSYAAADRVIDYVREEKLTVTWVLETHVHADHLSAAPYLQAQLGGRLAIGRGILRVQEEFGKLFNAGTEFARTGAEFDRLFDDGDRFAIGGVEAVVLHVPGHTSADLAYVIGDAAFVGDTLFMPDYGTARADFPGGDARQLFRSIRRLLALPDATRLFLCHDYKAPGRDRFVYETTVAAQRSANVHVRDGTAEDDFVAMREARDRSLKAPRLIMPAIQVNMRGGRLPEPEENGTRYLKIPLTTGRA